MYGDLLLGERLSRIEKKLDLVYDEVHKNRIDIHGIKVKIAVFGSIFGAISGIITTLISRW